MCSKLQCFTLVTVCICISILIWRLLMFLNNDTHVLGLNKGCGHLIGIYVTFALNRCSNVCGSRGWGKSCHQHGCAVRISWSGERVIYHLPVRSSCKGIPVVTKLSQNRIFSASVLRSSVCTLRWRLCVVTCVGACRNHGIKIENSELAGLCCWSCYVAVVFVANNHELSSCLIAVVEIKAFCSRFSRISQGTFVFRNRLHQ